MFDIQTSISSNLDFKTITLSSNRKAIPDKWDKNQTPSSSSSLFTENLYMLSSLLDPDINALKWEVQVYLHFTFMGDDADERLMTHSRLSDNIRLF